MHRSEARTLGAGLQLGGVTAVRVHARPRKRFFQHPNRTNMSRTTVCVEEASPKKVQVTSETAEEITIGQPRPGLWRGLTIFHRPPANGGDEPTRPASASDKPYGTCGAGHLKELIHLTQN